MKKLVSTRVQGKAVNAVKTVAAITSATALLGVSLIGAVLITKQEMKEDNTMQHMRGQRHLPTYCEICKANARTEVNA